MKHRVFQVLSTDGRRILLLASIVLLLAFSGVNLGQMVAANMLRADAQSTATAWAGSLVNSADDLPAIIAGAAPAARTDHLLKDAAEVGDIYRYKIWDRAGHAVFSSARQPYFLAAKTDAGSRSRCRQFAGESILLR
jgi:hypothetical protein